MNSNSRPVFCFHQDPKLIWNEVSGVSSYKFRLVERVTLKELWSIEISNPQCENGTCQCDYPQDKQFLKPLVSYLLIAEANDGEFLKEFQTEVILLEEEVQKAFQELENSLVKQGIQEISEVETKLLMFKKALSGKLNGTGWGNECRKCSYIGANFY